MSRSLDILRDVPDVIPGAVGRTHNERSRARIYKAIDEEEAITEGKRRLEDKKDEESNEKDKTTNEKCCERKKKELR